VNFRTKEDGTKDWRFEGNAELPSGAKTNTPVAERDWYRMECPKCGLKYKVGVASGMPPPDCCQKCHAPLKPKDENPMEVTKQADTKQAGYKGYNKRLAKIAAENASTASWGHDPKTIQCWQNLRVTEGDRWQTETEDQFNPERTIGKTEHASVLFEGDLYFPPEEEENWGSLPGFVNDQLIESPPKAAENFKGSDFEIKEGFRAVPNEKKNPGWYAIRFEVVFSWPWEKEYNTP